jgi:hypothetical protein
MEMQASDRGGIARRAHQLYDETIRSLVEVQHQGQYLALDITTGCYGISDNELRAIQQARVRNPDSILYLFRIGHPVTYRLGATSQVSHS